MGWSVGGAGEFSRGWWEVVDRGGSRDGKDEDVDVLDAIVGDGVVPYGHLDALERK